MGNLHVGRDVVIGGNIHPKPPHVVKLPPTVELVKPYIRKCRCYIDNYGIVKELVVSQQPDKETLVVYLAVFNSNSPMLTAQLVYAVNTIHYYESVAKKMGQNNAAEFVRLYMVPGMQHCEGGPGPDMFGQMGVAKGDPQHDLDAALERWVEQDIAPDQIIATKYKTGSDPASGVIRTRPLCPYPAVAHLRGTGSTDDAANFVCLNPAQFK